MPLEIVLPELPASLRGPLAVSVTAALMLAAAALARLWRRPVLEVHKRGAIVRRPGLLERRGVGCFGGAPQPLRLAGIALAPADETRHFKLIGTTGAGKTTLILDLLSQALERGDRALIADPDGGYYARCFDRYRGDVVLNPFERGSVRWDPFAELVDPYDVEQLASSLIASSADPGASEWRGYARTFLAALLRHGRAAHERDPAALWHRLAVAPAEELRALLAGTPAQAFLDPDNARMFGSIRSVAVAALGALEHVQAQRAPAFSVRAWVADGDARGCLFLPYKAQQIAALRSLIATWVRLAIFEALSGHEGRDQRLWFIVDELDALGAIEGLKDALARLRKFGGRCLLGFQSAAQVSGLYGADASTIVENCGNTVILRCSSSESGGTSQFASRLIGEREIRRRQVARHLDQGALLGRSATARRSRNTSDQHVIESAVLASEIERLPDLEGYLKRASADHWLKVSVRRPR